MANCFLGWQNNLTIGGMSASSHAAGMGAVQVLGPLGSASTAWQTTGCTAEWFQVDTGSHITWQAFVLARTNLSAAATVRWRTSDFVDGSNNITTPYDYDSGVVPAGVVAGYGQSVLIVPGAAVGGSHVRVDIADPTNPDGFLNIPLAFAGSVWQPATNASFATSLGRDDGNVLTVTRGGQEFVQALWNRRRWAVDLQGVRQSEIWSQVMALDGFARTGGNVLFVPDPASATVTQEAVFGMLKATADLTYPYGAADRRAWKATVSERL